MSTHPPRGLAAQLTQPLAAASRRRWVAGVAVTLLVGVAAWLWVVPRVVAGQLVARLRQCGFDELHVGSVAVGFGKLAVHDGLLRGHDGAAAAPIRPLPALPVRRVAIRDSRITSPADRGAASVAIAATLTMDARPRSLDVHACMGLQTALAPLQLRRATARSRS